MLSQGHVLENRLGTFTKLLHFELWWCITLLRYYPNFCLNLKEFIYIYKLEHTKGSIFFQIELVTNGVKLQLLLMDSVFVMFHNLSVLWVI